ncbi:MAG: hypothetical protein RDU20_11860, partial [Desulfomonilaceae bacterium]|nr:hypothetical protein [Desulfomonilaceae bacterium]
NQCRVANGVRTVLDRRNPGALQTAICQRFARRLTTANVRLGDGVADQAFTVSLFHSRFLARFDRRSRLFKACPSRSRLLMRFISIAGIFPFFSTVGVPARHL